MNLAMALTLLMYICSMYREHDQQLGWINSTREDHGCTVKGCQEQMLRFMSSMMPSGHFALDLAFFNRLP